MATEAKAGGGRERGRWVVRSGRPAGSAHMDLVDDEETYAALLDALTRDRLTAEAHTLEMEAKPRRDMASILEEEQRDEQEGLSAAHRELRTFREALRDARERGGPDGRGDVAYDAADPLRDRQADALIQYLVRPGYAEVRTDEPEPGHYVYAVRVDWDRLAALAREHGHALTL